MNDISLTYWHEHAKRQRFWKKLRQEKSKRESSHEEKRQYMRQLIQSQIKPFPERF